MRDLGANFDADTEQQASDPHESGLSPWVRPLIYSTSPMAVGRFCVFFAVWILELAVSGPG